MAAEDLEKALRARHRALDTEIRTEEQRPFRDEDRIRDAKRRKLALRDRIRNLVRPA